MTPSDQPPDRRQRPLDWPIDRDALRGDGERRRDAGVAAAACPKALRVRVGQVALLDALIRSPDGTATIDDATPPDDLRDAFADGGRWRGAIPLSLARDGLIEKVAAGASLRPSRHAGVRYVWRVVDRPKAIIARGRIAAAIEASQTTAADRATEPTTKHETPPAATDGASDGSNPKQEDSNRG